MIGLIIIFALFSFAVSYQPQVFVQDDWYHLYQIFGKSFFEVLNYFNIFQSGKIDSLNFYRPLSTKLYFYSVYQFFGLNPQVFFAINLILFFLNAWLFLKLAQEICIKKVTPWATFFYCFSLANFTLLSYLTKIEDLLFSIFAFLTMLGFLKRRNWLSPLFFIAALMSRESGVMIVPGMIIFLKLIKNQSFKQILKSTWLHLLILITYFLSRTFIYGWPKDKQVYILKLAGLHVIKNIAKYLQWNLNITGLIKEGSVTGFLSLGLLLILFFILTYSLVKAKKDVRLRKTILFGLSWWLVFLLPVIFFTDHKDPWNLIVASAGLSIILGQLVSEFKVFKKMVLGFCWLGLFFLGLNFYRQKHWTVMRAQKVKETMLKITRQCMESEIIIYHQSPDYLKELKYAWYYDLGPKVLCQNKNLKVKYIE